MLDIVGQTLDPSACACCSWTGWNQEDSIILNQSSVDRGIFRSTTYKTSRDELRSTTHEEYGARPNDKIVGKHQSGHGKVDPDGLVAPGEPVDEGDVILLKTAPAPAERGPGNGPVSLPRGGRRRRDVSTVVKRGDGGVVDAVCSTMDETNNNVLTKIRTRSVRVPQCGDKLASRHGQKASVLCGCCSTACFATSCR